MIKPIKITPINTSKTLQYKCENCNDFGIINLENEIINVDNNGNPEFDLGDYECECGNKL